MVSMRNFIIHNLKQLLNKLFTNQKKQCIFYISLFDAGVVQWLVYGLAKARMPVRSRSLAPYVFKSIERLIFYLFYDILNMSRKLAYNKKDTFESCGSNAFPLGQHLKSTVVEIRCFYYLNSKVITTKNNSRIIINLDNSLFVIINHHLSFTRKGKHLIYFKCIH